MIGEPPCILCGGQLPLEWWVRELQAAQRSGT